MRNLGVLAAWWVVALAACSTPVLLTQDVEARRLASDLQVQFTRAIEAGNRAVMSETDEGSAAAAREAAEAADAVENIAQELGPLLRSLTYSDVLEHLEAFTDRFSRYRTLETEILSLDGENTNLRAQRQSLGPARVALDSFRTAIRAAADTATPAARWQARALAAEATAAMLEISVLQAPHIVEAEDSEMTRIEGEMQALERDARRRLEEMTPLLPSGAGPHLSAARESVERFAALNGEIVALSRRNSNVRSLALSLGEKRYVTAECDDRLEALLEALDRHMVTPTR